MRTKLFYCGMILLYCLFGLGNLHAGYNPKIINLTVTIDNVEATFQTGHVNDCSGWRPRPNAKYVTWLGTKCELKKTHTIISENPTGLSATSKFSISDGFSLTNDGSIAGPNTVTNNTGRMTALTKTGEYKLVATATCENRSVTDEVIIAVVKLDKIIVNGAAGRSTAHIQRGNEITDSTDDDSTPKPKQVFCIERDGEKKAYAKYKAVLEPEAWTYACGGFLLDYIRWEITDDDTGCWSPASGTMYPMETFPVSSEWSVKSDYFLDDRKATLTAWYDRCGEGKLNSSDDPAWKRTVEIIAVGAIISGPPMDWEPKGGDKDNEVPVAIAAIPSEAKGTFTADLYDHSNEPGYCLNMPVVLPTTGEDSATWKDLRIQIDASCWTVSGDQDQSGVYSGPEVNSVDVPVISTDYGSWGKIKGYYCYSGDIKVRAWDINELTRNYANIPLDENGNHVPDIVEQDSYAALDEEDTKGDGFTGYEEWRGFIVNGAHVRTDAGVKRDLFIYDENSLGFGYYPTASGIVCHSIKDTEWTGIGSSIVPANSPNGTKPKRLMSINRGTVPNPAPKDQFGLHLKDGLAPGSTAGGYAQRENGTSGFSVKNTITVWVNKNGINSAYSPANGFPIDYAGAYVQRTITHEIGHATHVEHHGGSANRSMWCGGDTTCVMKYFKSRFCTSPLGTAVHCPLPTTTAGIPSAFCTACKPNIDVVKDTHP